MNTILFKVGEGGREGWRERGEERKRKTNTV
jgi:hypothetical protein